MREPSRGCQSPRTRRRPVPGGNHLGLRARPFAAAPAGGCPNTYFPKGLIGSEPLAAASPGPRWGASSPSTTAQPLVPGRRGLGPSGRRAWGRARPGLPPAGLSAAAWALARARAGHCARACVCAYRRVCIDRGDGGGGTWLFARLFPNMAPLLRTHGKKIQWFYQNKLLLVPEITFLNVVPTPGR